MCVSNDLLIEDQNGLNAEGVSALLEALLACVNMLGPNDYVCFNIANSSLKLFNDHQAQMERWQAVDCKFDYIKKVFNIDSRIGWTEDDADKNGDGEDKHTDHIIFDSEQSRPWTNRCRRFFNQFGPFIA